MKIKSVLVLNSYVKDAGLASFGRAFHAFAPLKGNSSHSNQPFSCFFTSFSLPAFERCIDISFCKHFLESERSKKAKRLAENDFYDSDDDSFLDRTGAGKSSSCS